MRDILFRGKRVDGQGWIEGSLIVDYQIENAVSMRIVPHSGHKIPYEWYAIYPETVSQYTGLKDKNGNMIFEGDKVQHKAWEYPFEIIFYKEMARFVCKMKTGLTQFIDENNLEVIGNIHDDN